MSLTYHHVDIAYTHIIALNIVPQLHFISICALKRRKPIPYLV